MLVVFGGNAQKFQRSIGKTRRLRTLNHFAFPVWLLLFDFFAEDAFPEAVVEVVPPAVDLPPPKAAAARLRCPAETPPLPRWLPILFPRSAPEVL
jgi:hypothetical protein